MKEFLLILFVVSFVGTCATHYARTIDAHVNELVRGSMEVRK